MVLARVDAIIAQGRVQLEKLRHCMKVIQGGYPCGKVAKKTKAGPRCAMHFPKVVS
jgi:hypothetical protein